MVLAIAKRFDRRSAIPERVNVLIARRMRTHLIQHIRFQAGEREMAPISPAVAWLLLVTLGSCVVMSGYDAGVAAAPPPVNLSSSS